MVDFINEQLSLRREIETKSQLVCEMILFFIPVKLKAKCINIHFKWEGSLSLSDKLTC